MPLYKYRCLKCDHEFEVIARFDEMEVQRDCPKCTHTPAARIEITDTHFELKGRGWNRLAWDRLK